MEKQLQSVKKVESEKSIPNSQLIYLFGEKNELYKYLFTKNIDYKDNVLISLNQIRKNQYIFLLCIIDN